MLNYKFIKSFLITLILLFFSGSVYNAYSVTDDGFGPAKRIEGKYFTIYYSTQLEPSSLARQLNVTSSDKVLAGGSIIEGEGFSGLGLTDMVDTLFMRVCNILDMDLYSFKGNIKICRDQKQISEIYNNLFYKELNNRRSFYVYSLNTIYISADSFKREILGHEIGHAVISHYFVVLPSVKVQEVLATYVEYQLRKSGK